MKRVFCLILTIATAISIVACSESAPKESKDKKVVIYQVFTRLFGSDNPKPAFDGDLSENGTGKFDDFTTTALDSIRAMGMTHIWYTGVIEHASIYSVDQEGGVQMNHPKMIKGKAGSPYAIKDYYDVNAYLATNVDNRMGEFEALVERSHAANLKVIIDFVPNHVARGYHSDVAPQGVENLGDADDNSVAFCVNNNFYYLPNERLEPKFETEHNVEEYVEFPAKATGNDVFTATPSINDWYETVKLNYGVDYQDGKKSYFSPMPDTWFKMRDILLFWAAKGVDGFRCDMAEMVPVEFWEWAIVEVKKSYPEVVFIAEIYNPKAYKEYIDKGGFDYLYDKVGLYDTLKWIVQGKQASSTISANRAQIADVQAHMLNFLENHDEQRIAWREFAGDAEAGIPMMLISTLSDNIPMMVYFGQELGVESPEATGFSGADGRTTIFDFWTVPEIQAWRNGGRFDGAQLSDKQKSLRQNYISILKMANQESLFIDGKFIDLTALNANSHDRVYAFARKGATETIFVVSNLSGETIKTNYSLPEELKGLSFESYLFNSFDGVAEKQIELGDDLEVSLAPYQGVVFRAIK